MPIKLRLSEGILADGSNLGARSVVRRSSLNLLRTRTSSFARNAASTPAFVKAVVPTEILERIIVLYVTGLMQPSWPDSPSTEYSFNTESLSKIGALAAVSRDTFFLTAREVCRREISFVCSKGAKRLCGFLTFVENFFRMRGWYGGSTWLRSIFVPSFMVSLRVHVFTHLTSLKTLRVDFSHTTLFTQRSSAANLFNVVECGRPFPNLTELILTKLARVDAHILTLISHNFPRLTLLVLDAVRALEIDCCPTCYEESLSRIMHSPIPEWFRDAQDLGIIFGMALSPLKHLRDLSLGIFLSHYHLLDVHTTHGSNEDDPSTVTSISGCTSCLKYKRSTQERELIASFYLACYLPSLSRITWATAFCMCRVGEDDGNDGIEGSPGLCSVALAFVKTKRPAAKSVPMEKKESTARCSCSPAVLKRTVLEVLRAESIVIKRVP